MERACRTYVRYRNSNKQATLVVRGRRFGVANSYTSDIFVSAFESLTGRRNLEIEISIFPDVPVPTFTTTYVNTTSSSQTLAESQYLDLNFPHLSHVNETNYYRHTRNFIRSNRNSPKNYKSKQSRSNTRNLVTINLKRGPPSTKAIPKCLVINALTRQTRCTICSLYRNDFNQY